MGPHALAFNGSLSVCRAYLIATASGLLVLSLRDRLESDMTRHMLVEFPLLLITGAAARHALHQRFGAQIDRLDQKGLVGFVFASMTLMYWMIPIALDAALLHGWVAAGKYVSLVLSGALLWSSFRNAPLPLQVFFVGNWVLMTTTIGLIYQSAPQQLCLNYLPAAQLLAGEGLVATAAIAGCTWCAGVARRFLA